MGIINLCIMTNKKIEYFLVFQHKMGRKWMDLKSFQCDASYRPFRKLEFDKYLSKMEKSKIPFKYIKRKDDNQEKKIEQYNSKEKYRGLIKLPVSGKVKYLLIFQQKKGNIWGDVKYFSCSSRYIPEDFEEYAKYKKAHKKKPNTRWIRRPIFNQKEKPLVYSSSYYKVIQEKKGNEWVDIKRFKCRNSLYEIIDSVALEKELSKIQSKKKEVRVIQRRISNS